MSEFVGLTAIVAIVTIVAIVFGFVFRAKIDHKGVELHAQAPDEKSANPKKRQRKETGGA